MKTCFFHLTLIFHIHLLFAQAQPDQSKIDVLSRVNSGQASLSASAWDIGHVNNCFDGDTTTLMRSANINPAFVQIAFTEKQSVNTSRVFLGQPGFPGIDRNTWWLECADTQYDLSSKAGTYRLIVPSRTDVSGTWDEALFSTVTAKIWKFTIERTVGDDYVHIPELELWTDGVPQNKFLIILSNPINETGILTNSLEAYQNDLANEGWYSTITTVNKHPDPTTDFYCPTEVELKFVTQYFYDLGYQGFVIIGSSKDIPTALWRHHTKREVDNPTDLYYADVDAWVDIDGNGIYETWDSKLVNGVWEADKTKPANPGNTEFNPEFFFGRIDAGPLCSSTEEEANKVNFYLNKIHDYRINGSPLSEEAQRSALFFRADEYAPNVWDDTYKEYMPGIVCNHGIMTGDVNSLKSELQKGHIFASIATHSGYTSHAMHAWINAKRQLDGFSLDDIRATNPKVHYWVLFACSAARFTEVNFGATYLFETDYAFNVSGSTGLWGVLLDPVCGRELNKGTPVGIVLRDFITRYAGSGDVWPKGILHGDPLLTYPIHNINKPPRIHDNLNYIEASVNQAFQLDFQITDPENDAVAFEIENIPDNATLAGYTLCWTPAWEQADSTFILRAKATDTHNNSYTAIFTIYVNIVQDGLLHSLTNWQISGDGSAYISSYEQPFKSHNTVIQTQNNWGAIQQQIVVDPYRLYRIELWIAKQINLNSNHTFLQIEEPGRRFLFDDFIDSDTYYDENGLLHTYCAIPFRTGNHEQIILSLHSGDEQKSTSGKLYLTGLRLVDEGPSREILFTKVLTGPLVEDGGYSNCAAFGDFDHDSYPDLFISNHAGNNFLYKNNRDGTFSKIINNIIVQDNAAADGGVWGDFNRDGYADLFVSNWGDAKNVLYRNNYDGSFSKINDSVFEKDQGTSHKGAWTDFNNDGFLDLFVPVSGGYNMLYAGDGYGGFKRITDGAVVNEWSVSTGACWGDYNGDFYLDVFVANGYGENNYLYKNNGDGTFTKVTSGSIVNDGGKSRGGCWGDYDNDGRIDLFVFNYGDEDNFLYHNNGNGTFTKTTTGDIVNDGGDSQDARWGDIDMDGDIDLFVANYDGQNNFLYSNNGDGTFTKITDDITVNEGGTSAGCDWADCDWDGDLDLVVANTGGENNFYYLNNNAANNNWFRIRIQGHRGITAKIGIKAHISDVAVWWWRDISGQTIAGVTSNGLAVTFGVGHAGIIDSLMIKWPSGGIQVKEHIDINKELVIREPTYQTITFCERAASDYHDVTFDSHIREKHYAQKRNYGATDNIRVLGTNTSAGEWRGLLKFDFRPGLIAEGVTDASQIMRADISLRLSESEGSELNMMNLYKIIQDWGEGKKNNEYAMYGDVTWKSAKHGIANWTQAGAKSTIYDHVAIPVATTIIGNDVGHYYHFDVTSSVREMFTDQQNYGWLMVLEKEAGMRYFCSKEATDPWYRPFLIIYCTPAAPSTNNLLFADNSNANFSDVTSDAHIREINFAQNKNYGATDNIRILGSNPAAKEWKGLLKFDFIPALSAAFNDADAIVSAKIRLYLSESEGTKNDNLFFYRLLQDWSEGTHNNDPASSGEVTWLSAHHWQQTWQTPGGYCSPIPAVQQSVGNTIESWYEFDVTKSVQTMFSSNQNYGWLLRLEANAGMRYFRSRECANPAHRPQLIVSISGQQQKSVAHKNISTTVPDAFALFQNYPNPFNPTTAIEFALPEPTFVTLKIYNALGAEITTLVSQRLGAGIHSYVWNASEFGSGTYLCRLQAGKFLQTKKLVFLH